MTPKWGHADINDMPNRAAGGTPLTELTSQRGWYGQRRAALWLCSQAGVPLSCRNTRDAASSSALLFCYCSGTARGLLCSGKHQGLRYLHFSEEWVPTIQQAEASPQSALLRSVCRLGSAKSQGRRHAIAALLLHQSLNPAFPSEPTLTEQYTVCWQWYR